MFTLNCSGRLIVIDRPMVMGVINLTPDSFYPGSRNTHDDVFRSVEKMITDGADIIDVGAQSSRPRAATITEHEELSRLDGVFAELSERFPDTIYSVDTFFSRVARQCIAEGASIINDISAGEMDSAMMATAAKAGVPYICMHMRGTPATMMQHAQYENVVTAVIDHFVVKIDQCLKAGIKDIIIDPGFGFSKNIQHNFELLKNLSALKMLERPVLVGLSRKSTIYKTLGISVSEALNGTTVLNTIALMNGAHILRVHDVKEAVECVKLVSALG